MNETYTAAPIYLIENPVLAQFDPHHRWNGFIACPRLDPVGVERIMAELNVDAEQQDPRPSTHEWDDEGCLIITDYDGEDRYYERLTPDEDGLYALGSFSWCWDEDLEATEQDAL